MNRTRIAVAGGIAVVVGVFAWLLWGGIDSNIVYFLTPSELMAKGTGGYDAPVRIGHAAPPDGFDDLLLNLADEVPAFFSKFERVAEIVGGDAAAKANARERFRFYRDRGYELETHQV